MSDLFYCARRFIGKMKSSLLMLCAIKSIVLFAQKRFWYSLESRQRGSSDDTHNICFGLQLAKGTQNRVSLQITKR